MTAPNVATQPVFNRAAAKAAGATDAQIDEYLRTHPMGPTGPRDSAVANSFAPDSRPVNVSAPAGYAGNFMTGLARAGAQGASLGFADELEAAARAPFSSRGYGDIRGEIRGSNAAFSEENPVLSAGANMLGGIATGGPLLKGASAAARAIPALSRMAPAATSGWISRTGRAMIPGAGVGAVAGAGAADEMRSVPLDMVKGAALGGPLAGVMSLIAEGTGGARNIASGVGQGNAPASGVRRFVRADGPEQLGAQRVLNTMGRTGQSTADLAAASAAAPPETAVAELIKDNQGVRGLRIARNMGRSRDAIDASLTERAAEEPANWSRSLGQHTGVPEARDVNTVKQEALAAIKPQVEQLYGQSYQQPAVADSRIAHTVDVLKSLPEFGPAALRRAQTIAATRGDPFPETFRTAGTSSTPGKILTASGHAASTTPATPPTLVPTSVGHMHDLRKGIDEVLGNMQTEIEKGGGSPEVFRAMNSLRDQVDGAVKDAGGSAFRQADDLTAGAMARGESFAQGTRMEHAPTAESVARIQSSARDPKALQEGVASQLQARAAGTPDGGGGPVRNPVSTPMASKTARAKTAAGYPSQAAFNAGREDATKIVDRLLTRQRVSGNSTTAANASEIVDEFMQDPSHLLTVHNGPKGIARRVLGGIAGRAVTGLNAEQAAEMGKILAAGLPGQMTRDEAITALQKWEPGLREKFSQAIARRAGAAGAGTRMALEKNP